MKRWPILALAVVAAGFATVRNAPEAVAQAAGWKTVLDGKSLDNFNKIGDANWRVEDGAVVADKGSGFLVTKDSYGDFELKAEFWADEDANSGIFIRVSNPEKIGSDSSYEVNIFDKRPEPAYGTGAIVDVAKVEPMPKAAGKWNTYEITAKGSKFTVVLNGQKTVDNAENTKFAKGPIGLQYAPGVTKDKGVIKFRKVEIKPL